MKKTICIFFSSKKIDRVISFYKDYIENLPSQYETFYFINFYKIINNNKEKLNDYKKYEQEYNIKVICPETKNEFNEFAKQRLIFAFDSLDKTISYFKLRSFLNKKNIKLIFLQNIGSITNQTSFENNISTKNFLHLIKKVFNTKLFRLLVFLKFFSPIFIYFECRRDFVKHFQTNEKKHKNKKSLFNYLYFENTIFVNGRSYDKFSKNIYNNSEDKIIFIDGNYKALDILQRENLNLEQVKIDYFNKLQILLKNISKVLNKEVIICLHPDSNPDEYKKFFDGFKLTKYSTVKDIYSSFIVIFHESSSIDTAIFLKKRILSLKTNLFGKYFENRIQKYSEALGLMSVNLNEKFEYEKKYIDEKTKVNEEKYNDFIQTYLKSDEDEDGISKVFRILGDYFNLLDRQYEK